MDPANFSRYQENWQNKKSFSRSQNSTGETDIHVYTLAISTKLNTRIDIITVIADNQFQCKISSGIIGSGNRT